MKPFQYYLIYFSILFLLGLLFVLAIWFFGSSSQWIEMSLLNLIFMYILTLLSFALFYATFKEKNKNAPLIAVMLSFTGKLIFSGLLILILQRIMFVDRIIFFVTFAASYVWFTIPEVVSLVRIGDYISRKEKDDR